MKKTTKFYFFDSLENGKACQYPLAVVDSFKEIGEAEADVYEFFEFLTQKGIRISTEQANLLCDVVEFYGPSLSAYTRMLRKLDSIELVEEFFKVPLDIYYATENTFEELTYFVKWCKDVIVRYNMKKRDYIVYKLQLGLVYRFGDGKFSYSPKDLLDEYMDLNWKKEDILEVLCECDENFGLSPRFKKAIRNFLDYVSPYSLCNFIRHNDYYLLRDGEDASYLYKRVYYIEQFKAYSPKPHYRAYCTILTKFYQYHKKLTEREAVWLLDTCEQNGENLYDLLSKLFGFKEEYWNVAIFAFDIEKFFGQGKKLNEFEDELDKYLSVNSFSNLEEIAEEKRKEINEKQELKVSAEELLRLAIFGQRM